MTFSVAALWGKIAAWAKRLFMYGKQIAALEERVTALEKTLSEGRPPDVCECCGERGMQ
jgi:hypothetical protein